MVFKVICIKDQLLVLCMSLDKIFPGIKGNVLGSQDLRKVFGTKN